MTLWSTILNDILPTLTPFYELDSKSKTIAIYPPNCHITAFSLQLTKRAKNSESEIFTKVTRKWWASPDGCVLTSLVNYSINFRRPFSQNWIVNRIYNPRFIVSRDFIRWAEAGVVWRKAVSFGLSSAIQGCYKLSNNSGIKAMDCEGSFQCWQS